MAIKFLSGLNLSNVTAGSILKLDSNGNIVAATAGTDYLASSLWTTSGSNIYYSSGNVTIGTSSNSAPLHVYGYQTTDPKLLIEDGNTGDASMQFKISTQSYTMGIDNSDSDRFKITAGTSFGTSGIEIDSSHNIGIAGTPTSRLHLYGHGANDGEIRIDSGGDNTEFGIFRFIGDSSTYEKYLIGYNSAHISQAHEISLKNTGGDITFYTGTAGSAAEKVRITSGGNVGIGVSAPPTDLSLGDGTHTSPDDTNRILNWYSATGGDEITNSSHYITVGQSSSDTTQPKSVGLALFNQNTANNTYSPAITFGGLSTSGNYMNGAAAIAAQLISNTNDNNFRSGELTFYTQGSTTATRGLVERMRITSTGNVGIGTTSPAAKLDVQGTGVSTAPTVSIVNTSSATFNHSINALAPNLTSGENNIFIIGRAASTKNSGYIGYKYSSAGSNDNVLTFGHWASDNLMNLTGDGKLGIGTESPSTMLSVRATTATHQLVGINRANSDTAALYLGNNSSNDAIISGNNAPISLGKDVSGTYTEYVNIATDGELKFSAYGAGILKTNASGIVSVDTSTYVTDVDWSDINSISGTININSTTQIGQGDTETLVSFQNSGTERGSFQVDDSANSYFVATGFKTATASTGFLKANGTVDTSTYLTSVAFSDITSKPTTLAGYGITDGATVDYVDTEVSGLASESWANTNLVNVTGDTMTGDLTIKRGHGDLTFLTLKQENTSGDLVEQKSFIDFTFVDSNTNETPQVRIGAEVGNNDGSASSLAEEGMGAFVVYTNNADTDAGAAGTSLAERFRVDYSGKVGIGTANPNYKLDVNGTLRATTLYSPIVRVSGSSDHLTLRSDVQVDQGATDPIIEFAYGTTQMGKFDQDGYMYATGFKTTTASTGFLKADGSVDTTTYASGSDYLALAGGTMTGDLTIPAKIIHSGDTNTYFLFGTDTITLTAGGYSGIAVESGIVKSHQDFVVTGGETFALGERAEGDDNGRTVLIEGAANAGNGEGSGRIFFTEHNSTTASADKYGLSLYYEGDPNVALPSGFQPNTGNATWSLRRHSNSVNGAAIMSGSRDNSNVLFGGKISITTADANTTSTTALVLNGTEVEKRSLGSNAFTSTTYAPLASPALTGTPTAPTAAAGTNTTQIATTAFVSTAVSNLVDSAPAALDTLNELAAALGDDASFSTTVSTALGNRLRIDVSDQNLTATQKSNAITNLGLGTAATSAATDFVAVSGDTMTGSLTVEGDLTVGKDGATPQVKLIYDDNHTNGDRWDTIIDIGRTQDRHSGDDQYPTYVTDNGYSISFQSNSDGVLFGMEEYSAGNYRPVIAWGDDNSDTPFNFRFNNSVKMSLAYNGVLTTAGNVVAGGNLKTTLNLDMRGQDVENATNVIYFNANNGNTSNTSNDVGTGITWKPLYSGYTKRSAGIMQIGEGNYFKSGLAFYTNNASDASTDWSERMRISKEGYVGIGISEPTKPLHVDGAIEAGGKITYLKSYGSLDTTGNAVAGLEESFNGASALFTFTCYGDTGGYQKIVYSCWNTSGTTWNVEKVIDEGTNDFDVTVDASGATRTFTFAARSGTKAYSPRVIVEASGSALDEQYL